MKISEYIENDLIQKIRADSPLLENLTLTSLASEYDVSLTPVRAALENLIESNYILKGENGRLNVNSRRRAKTPSKSGETNPRHPQKSLDEIVTKDVIHLSIQGGPTYLREESSAQRYGVGRTVIRQVFNRLSGSGLIDRVPRRGWQVHPFRERDMLDYIDVRETLELKALSLAKKRFQLERLKEFIAANSADPQGHPQLDNNLHQYWIDLSENRYIQSFFAQYGVYYSYLFNYSTIATSVIEEKAAEHQKILRALIDEDWDTAARALKKHIRAQRPNVTHLFDQLA